MRITSSYNRHNKLKEHSTIVAEKRKMMMMIIMRLFNLISFDTG